MTALKVGIVTHYFNKIGVAVVDLVDTLTVGETVKIGDPGFEQKIGSMQVEHERIDSANKGETIGIKVDQPVKKGDELVRTAQ